MRKIVVTEFLTLDGVMQGPGDPNEDRDGGFPYGGWQMQYGFDDAQLKRISDAIGTTDAYLLGRHTYDIFAAYWPLQTEGMFAEVLNPRPKYVVSTTLQEPLSWQNSHVIRDNVAERVRELKEQDGGNISILGSGKLVQFLLDNHLVDQLALLVNPLILGTGKRLFTEGLGPQKFRLVDSLVGDQGAAMLWYEPIDEPVTAS